MPLPFALDHINLWLLDDEIEGERGWTVVDCGVATETTRAAWEQLFDTVFDGRPLLRVISTHFHPDHLGNADWLCRGGARGRWQAPLWMSATEYAYGRFLSAGGGDVDGSSAVAHFTGHGLRDAESLDKVRQRSGKYYPSLVPAVPSGYRRISDGDEIAIGTRGGKRIFRILVGSGHSPEHVSLFSGGSLGAETPLLIAGDMVLPRISTNVSVFDIEPEGDPLPRYLHSLDRLLTLPQNTLVLPSHGKPFVGLHTRIAQQHAHHDERLAEVEAACATACSAVDIVPVLFKRKLDMHQMNFALGESIAHLHALWHQGRLARTRDADGVYRFRRV
jgi:glyoxylase-like metal-dependent hydrolase (beta-lactamase superfamily II)